MSGSGYGAIPSRHWYGAIPSDILPQAALVLVADAIVLRDLVEYVLGEVAAQKVVLERGAEFLALHHAVVTAAQVLEARDELDVLGLALGLQKVERGPQLVGRVRHAVGV